MGTEYGQLVGHEIGHWRVVRLLGTGGFGAVYEAQHKHIAGRLAAIKVLHPQLLLRGDADDLKRRFVNEASAASRADHENIVQVFDAGIAPDGLCYVVMEFLRGSSLTQIIAQAGRLPVERVANVGAQVASALAAAHGINIVHRDLKPDNIFLVPRTSNPDFVKVLDFGIAKLADSDVHTKTGAILGTPSYMSPEQWRSAPDLDGRSDLYGLGVILFECLTGQKPFQGGSLYDLANAHVNAAIPDPATYVPLPGELRNLVMQLLAKRPEDRPTSAADVITCLRSMAGMAIPGSVNTETRSQGGIATPLPVLSSTPSDLTRVAHEVLLSPMPTTSGPDLATTVTGAASSRSHRWRWLLAGSVLVLCVTALGLYKVSVSGGSSQSRSASPAQREDTAATNPVQSQTPQTRTLSAAEQSAATIDAGAETIPAPGTAKAKAPLVPTDMVFFPEADFPIGSAKGADRTDFPIHVVHIKPFALSRFEVSLGEFRDYAEQTNATGATPWKALQDVESMLRLPMNRVTRDQAAAYCAWRYQPVLAKSTNPQTRHGRLPTEEEWEYAARSASQSAPYPWPGSEISILRVNAGRKPAVLAPVDSFAEGASGQGIRHLLGNVAEWTSSSAAPYPGSHARIKSGAVARGGSVTSNLGDLSVTARTVISENTATPFLGLRCALDME